MEIALIFAYVALAAVIFWRLFVWVGNMAERRAQSRLLWQLIALFITPLAAALLLYIFCKIDPSDATDQRHAPTA